MTWGTFSLPVRLTGGGIISLQCTFMGGWTDVFSWPKFDWACGIVRIKTVLYRAFMKV